MNLNLSPYAGKRICVAVSGGADSMALLHYLLVHAKEHGITLSALNCDHGIRGEESRRDSAFVEAYCGDNGIFLHKFAAEEGRFTDENGARKWRLKCYKEVIEGGFADFIATAHHMNDNAETVLFNLARGSGLAGMAGITDLPAMKLIRPMIACTREEIDAYVEQNGVPFVVDATNLTDAYTRNKIRRSVLPALQEAAPGAVRAIYRFSRLAAEDEEYLSRQAEKITVRRPTFGYVISPCAERVIFKRAAHAIIAGAYGRKDYTAEQLERLFSLQSADNGKAFGFLGLTAVKEEQGVAIVEDGAVDCESAGVPFLQNLDDSEATEYAGCVACLEYWRYADETAERIRGAYDVPVKTLKFDLDAIPPTAVIRFKRAGDKFTKFGGGSNSLSDYLTDKKIPQSLRATLPLVCDGSEVLMVGGVEISDKVKVVKDTMRIGAFICADPLK